MSRTYKAVQVTQPGKFEVVERSIIEPDFGQVRIRVETCGVCHTDALTVEGEWAWVIWVAIAGVAKTVAGATSSIARINPFRGLLPMVVMPK